MKKIFYLVIIIFSIFLLTGCQDSATVAVENYLNKYNALDDSVLSDMNSVIDRENLNDENKKIYEDILKKQYSDLKYEITNENYAGDEATISVKITVYDLYSIQDETNNYLVNNQDEFNDENGEYDVQKYLNYKLGKMSEVTKRTDYTIDFYVINSDSGWVVSSLSNSDIEKIHGIYNYE